MSFTWSTRKQFYYLVFFVVFGIVLFIVPSFFVKKTVAPTCFDNKQNQGEEGVDCGGPCSLICENRAKDPVVKWQDVLEVNDGIYNAIAYVENPNSDGAYVLKAPYVFRFYDEKEILLGERRGETSIPPKPLNNIFTVFESRISLSRKPAKAEFEFITPLIFESSKVIPPEINISNQVVTSEDSSPRLTAFTKNISLDQLRNVEFVAVIYGVDGLPRATSKTVVDNLLPNVSQNLVFTWPKPFSGGTSVCAYPVDVVIAIDRSGSMDDDGQNPPEPLTSVKKAAVNFISKLNPLDQVSVISFATHVYDEVDSKLTSDSNFLKKTIENISIKPIESSYTNIGEPILRAREEFNSRRHNKGSKKVLILLTDGVANFPENSGDEKYAEEYAVSLSTTAKREDIEIYTIGLGSGVNSVFLKRISSSGDHYIPATSESINSVYERIANELCSKSGVSKIEIIPKLTPGINY